ncbi:MAG: ROK family protein, partial [Longimicrobiales bacterium]
IVDGDGHVTASARAATDAERGFEAIVLEVEATIRSLGPAVEHARAVGVGVAGQVDRKTGVVRYAPNLRWHEAPLGPTIEQRLGLPVVVSNDVRAAAWGEWHHGAARGVDDLVVVFVGTGVGGGVISGGRLLDGCTNAAGELGHMTIAHGGRRCRCGNHGCLEAYAGGWAIAERAREAVASDPDGGARIAALARPPDGITAATVTEAADEGDAFALKLISETTDYLASGIVAIANAFNPCMFVLGGGVLDHRPEELERLRTQVAERALGVVSDSLRIVPAALAGQAGVIGAASMAAAALGRIAD